MNNTSWKFENVRIKNKTTPSQQLTTASTSSSSSTTHQYCYDVFPSFSGKDVRRTFLSHFLEGLQSKGIKTFIDNGIMRSESINSELVKAIRESRISVVILSENYASSSWCLDELQLIIDCRVSLGQTLMPVFYNVEPSDVRNQTGDFGKAFEKVFNGKKKVEKERWRQALTQVAAIAGEHSVSWDNDAEMIEKIVADVSDELNRCTPSKDFDGLVGLEAHVAKLCSMLCLESNEVRMIGIWGPIGIGKTTIARALYSQLSAADDDDNFQLNIFMENIKGSCRRNELDGYSLKLHLQERFLSEIFNQRDIKISHLGVAQERLKNQKALIVLDDVDELQQLHALADQTQWFGNGTRIIVTTEDKQLLKAHGINHVYEVGFPSKDEAIKILCRYAFGQNSAPEGFYDLAVEFSQLSGNLPLSLSVLGASLRGMSKEEWTKALPRFRTSLNGKIEKVFGVCYDSLDEKDRLIFLHIACLFNGEKVERVIQFLAKSELEVEFGLKVLVDRSLLHICDDGNIVMHCLLQQMGKEIIRGQCIDEPGKRKFLVDAKEISDVLVDATGTETVLGISLDMSKLNDDVCTSEKAFDRMHNLQLLRLYTNFQDESFKLCLPHGLDRLPHKLRLLHWDSYPIKCMPSRFRPEFLVELSMRDSKLEKLWEGIQPLTSLKQMDLSASTKIKDIPNLSKATNLENLYLRFCKGLASVPSSLQNLNKLKVLDMSSCVRLNALPTNMNLESLSVLNMKGCSKLRIFPEISSQVKFMSVGETAIEEVPLSISLWPQLISLEMSGCKKLKTFPKLPASVEVLDLSSTGIEEIPWWIENASQLLIMCMANCKKLKCVPPSIYQLKHLEDVDLSGCSELRPVLSSRVFEKCRKRNNKKNSNGSRKKNINMDERSLLFSVTGSSETRI
ncbi:PREDICTED: putative disease resistance protein At4g11170 [Brassica oleracea var. oleracea]|uniref:putative disease resistance protein At4g11170 n=1 Tax=Brassica oleracea var. oleracea TaxID=109376 RepID=UPI0006A6DEB3|nr:PREDICTED: putative disease resistance protein At4g11170 [Brassica oleracea var. oleracea]